jgi:hypothetical protein
VVRATPSRIARSGDFANAQSVTSAREAYRTAYYEKSQMDGARRLEDASDLFLQRNVVFLY